MLEFVKSNWDSVSKQMPIWVEERKIYDKFQKLLHPKSRSDRARPEDNLSADEITKEIERDLSAHEIANILTSRMSESGFPSDTMKLLICGFLGINYVTIRVCKNHMHLESAICFLGEQFHDVQLRTVCGLFSTKGTYGHYDSIEACKNPELKPFVDYVVQESRNVGGFKTLNFVCNECAVEKKSGRL